MSKSTDGWTTVRRDGAAAGSGSTWGSGGGGGSSGYRRWGDSTAAAAAEPAREMPSAFGGGNRERQAARREEDARRAWEERRAATEKERAAVAEAERQKKLRDFTNTEQYPALGGAGAAAKPKVAASPLNFRDMARETAARTVLEEAEAVAAAKRRELEAARRSTYASGGGSGAPRLYRHGSYDDGPVDHDYPDEEGYYQPDEGEYDTAPPAHADEDGAEAEAEVEAEFNSHLAVTRRRGDKSDW